MHRRDFIHNVLAKVHKFVQCNLALLVWFHKMKQDLLHFLLNEIQLTQFLYNDGKLACVNISIFGAVDLVKHTSELYLLFVRQNGWEIKLFGHVRQCNKHFKVDLQIFCVWKSRIHAPDEALHPAVSDWNLQLQQYIVQTVERYKAISISIRSGEKLQIFVHLVLHFDHELNKLFKLEHVRILSECYVSEKLLEFSLINIVAPFGAE
mmetsp:Transcript_9333/g.34559  ORF Transcript_9333/g.34559 Transcript_9333/m.34559 type:complete len:207 (-) Transcript_9333:1892-2512(-)